MYMIEGLWFHPRFREDNPTQYMPATFRFNNTLQL